MPNTTFSGIFVFIMSELDDQITSLVRQLEAADAAAQEELLAAQAQAAEAAEAEATLNREAEERANEVQELCGKFIVWAVTNRIPYNSPSPFAPGWLLGKRSAGPSSSHHGYGASTSVESTSSLLVNGNGNIKELVVSDATKAFGKRRHHLFAHKAFLAGYTPDSIKGSIADYVHENGVPWHST